MGIQAPPAVKFEIIDETLKRNDNRLNVKLLCELACVSKSGYYNWVNSKPNREKREQQDLIDFKLIEKAFNHRYPKGAKGIKMTLMHNDVLMSLNKIRRLMRKYGLVCKIRSVNPYTKMLKANKANKVAPNIVNREFRQEPRKVLLTDITYLQYQDKHCYLSTILDAYTKEILSKQVSETLEVDFVLKTVDELVEKYGAQLDDRSIVHSDQGSHYTSKQFVQKLKDNDFVQSMSRKGNCWDNAPQESFFSHLKAEIRDRIFDCTTFEQVVSLVDDWIDYYNNERYQWNLQKLSPRQFYDYVKYGVDPLAKFR